MRLGAGLEKIVEAQRGTLAFWLPVGLALGIGIYFKLPIEPPVWGLVLTGGLSAMLLGFVLGARRERGGAWVLLTLVLVGCGFVLAGARAHYVAAPVLEGRTYGAVEGRIIALDRSSHDLLRLTLDQVILERLAPDETPARLRVSLHGSDPPPVPGSRVVLTANLLPPSGPAEPDGFDFRRYAWFHGLGGMGYTRAPVLRIAPPEGAWIFRARMALADRIRQGLPGAEGGFAAALLTGDRSAIDAEDVEALRRANLAHLLAISGLHMGLLTAFVYGVVRLLLATIPYTGLNWHVKKIAAGVAITVGAFYLVLSGGSVATQRAFIMTAVAFGAVIADRQVLTLRTVALAAALILIMRPESLPSPGFQMSFAATTALVMVFGFFRAHRFGSKWLRAVLTTILSSAIAGAATAPFAAAHFNQISQLGLPANLLTVPLMGLLVIPAGVAALCLMPFGIEAVPLWVMGWGLRWILFVAEWISEHPNAIRPVVAPGSTVLPLLALGAVLFVLLRGWIRSCGVAVVFCAFILWGRTERPTVLIEQHGALVGIKTAEGRALSRARGGGFAAGIWLQNDGDKDSQAETVLRWSQVGRGVATFAIGNAHLYHVHGKTGLGRFTGCSPPDIVISDQYMPRLPCTVLDAKFFRNHGSVEMRHDNQLWHIRSARLAKGVRLWTPRPSIAAD